MPRPPRLEYENALYHVTSRGNGRQDIFLDDRDRRRFLDQLRENLSTYGVVLYAYVLMSNHYHLLVRTPRANLARFMQRLNSSYALYFRYRHKKPGHAFQGRYIAKVVGGDDYLRALTRYIHLNPVRTEAAANWSRATKLRRLSTYRWSSYPGYVRKESRQEWVCYDVLTYYGRNRASASRLYRGYMEAALLQNDQPLLQALKASRYAVGDEEFVKETEEKLRNRKRGDVADKDVAYPRRGVRLEWIDEVVAEEYGLFPEALKRHGRAVGEAKRVAVELAVRLSGENFRAIGQHYGGISSQAVAMIRRKVREGGVVMEHLLDRLGQKLATSRRSEK